LGFKPVKTAGGTSATDPLRFVEWVLRELSLVTLPANTEATISAVRSADAPFVAASGDHPGVPGSRRTTQPTNPRGTMTAQERAAAAEARRAAALARCEELNAAAATEGRSLNEDEATDYAAQQAIITAAEADVERERALVAQQARTAVPLPATPAAPGQRNTPAPAPAAPVVTDVRSAAAGTKGIQFARQAMALASCNGNRFEAAEYARNVFGDEDVAVHIRAAIAPGTTANATFAAPLVQTNYLDDFLELLRPKTIIGNIPGLRHVPFNVSMPSQTAGGTYKWVGENKPKPLTNMQFASVALGMAKASGIIVLTEELIRSSSPSAQMAVRDELLNGIPAFLDAQFVDPAVAAVANVSPASITNGVAGTAASGTTEAAARADLRALLAGFASGNYSLSGVVLLMSESVAFTLGTLVNAVGETAFPGLTPMGGNILGIPVVTSNAVGAQIIAVHAPSILLADEGGVEIDISREASLQMDSAPDDPTTASTVLVSLWQNNLVGLRGERFINWAKARSDAVRRIHTVAYA
jgi:HK97 family phage major capsid protein